jgi:hypothetical protein
VNRSFNRFWAGQTVSEFGDQITGLALPLIAVVTLSATTGQVGLLIAAVGGLTACLWLLPSPIPRLRTLDALPEPVAQPA